MKPPTHSIKTGEDRAIIDIVSGHGGTTRFTIEFVDSGYALMVNAVYIKAGNNGPGTDGMSIAPIDKNTVALFM